MDTTLKLVQYVTDYINSVPASSWYALGTLLAGSAIVTAIVAWINRSRAKKDLEKLGRVMVTWVVAFLSALVTILDFVINNGSTFGAFLPYFATHTVQVIGISTAIYNVAKPSLAWWKARKEGRVITNPNLPTFDTIPAVTSQITPSGQPSSSMGSEATGNVIQL